MDNNIQEVSPIPYPEPIVVEEVVVEEFKLGAIVNVVAVEELKGTFAVVTDIGDDFVELRIHKSPEVEAKLKDFIKSLVVMVF